MANTLLERALNHVTRFVAEEVSQQQDSPVNALAKHPLASVVAGHLAECHIVGCERFTIGAVCSQCSKHACQQHIFMTLTVPPAFVCGECVAQEFEIPRGTVIVEDPPPTKKSKKRK